ncbi:hypothetical protein IQ249_24740 [Lusitaniella coriacea LEGE 07157]|uniref:Uncharacterized protein n=1 Tax=Lusitaniella coriacea LEGE 07157 TaxID=945747 RepID=A0A8J7IY32_9CYAN|nr:hypothetical protein [Lusitaniella coriacea]MBE9119068.1 hypothetical protein [Lusitaniella coriacea LEGE 07157]
MASRGRKLIFQVARDYKGYRKGNKETIIQNGYFSTFEGTKNFLDIPDEKIAARVRGGVITWTDESEVSASVLGGTADADAVASFKRAEKEILHAVGGFGGGGRNVRIKTNKVVANSKSKSSIKPRHTISFLFPGWANLATISDALAEIIPEAKFGGGDNEIPPIFYSPSGRAYPIISKAAADTREFGSGTGGSSVIDTPEEQAELQEKVKNRRNQNNT